MKEKTNLVIFDFDGVIADSLHQIHQVLNQLADEHGFKKIDTDEHFSDIIEGNMMKLVEKLKIPKLSLPGIIIEYKHELSRIEDQIHLFPGMNDVIQELAKTNTLCIVSANHNEVIKYVLKRNNLLQHFKAILGLEYSFHKTQRLQHVMKRFNAEHTIFITDTLGDVKDAKEVEGLKTIGVKWGYHTWNKKDKPEPDYIADRPEDIIYYVSLETSSSDPSNNLSD